MKVPPSARGEAGVLPAAAHGRDGQLPRLPRLPPRAPALRDGRPQQPARGRRTARGGPRDAPRGLVCPYAVPLVAACPYAVPLVAACRSAAPPGTAALHPAAALTAVGRRSICFDMHSFHASVGGGADRRFMSLEYYQHPSRAPELAAPALARSGATGRTAVFYRPLCSIREYPLNAGYRAPQDGLRVVYPWTGTRTK
jgi:hypothetical protein